MVEAIGREEFLILPHPEVRDYATRRAAENERWLRGMRAAVGRFVTNCASRCDETVAAPLSPVSGRQRTSGVVDLVAIIHTE